MSFTHVVDSSSVKNGVSISLNILTHYCLILVFDSDRHLGANAKRCLTEYIAVHNSS